ncbi:MAG: hypothetical protein ACI9HK_003815, partial [Pirellulaceae bacterium]
MLLLPAYVLVVQQADLATVHLDGDAERHFNFMERLDASSRQGTA